MFVAVRTITEIKNVNVFIAKIFGQIFQKKPLSKIKIRLLQKSYKLKLKLMNPVALIG